MTAPTTGTEHLECSPFLTYVPGNGEHGAQSVKADPARIADEHGPRRTTPPWEGVPMSYTEWKTISAFAPTAPTYAVYLDWEGKQLRLPVHGWLVQSRETGDSDKYAITSRVMAAVADATWSAGSLHPVDELTEHGEYVVLVGVYGDGQRPTEDDLRYATVNLEQIRGAEADAGSEVKQ